MADTEYKWRDAVADAHTAAAEAFAYSVAEGHDLDDGAAWDAASEWADGSEWVIYTYRARCLWFDSAEVQDAEDETTESVEANACIDYRIGLCVYTALRDAFAEKWCELAAERENAEGVTA